MRQLALFGDPPREGFVLLRGFARQAAPELLAAVDEVTRTAPFRRMTTPGGRTMSVAMSNCGRAGWVTDAKGYRYTGDDPVSGDPWPSMPAAIHDIAVEAAQRAGYAFAPDACLINRYEPGARMGLHSDADEPDDNAPIVSISLGLPAVFLFGGLMRTAPVERMVLEHGDVVVWGGPLGRAFHGVAPLKDGTHPMTGRARFNFTVRTAL
ncbi:MAG: DNA oxidative demethylase AlkB [Asticcacaulis sp.]